MKKMKFLIKNDLLKSTSKSASKSGQTGLSKVRTDCIVLGVYETSSFGSEKNSAAVLIDSSSAGSITKLFKQGDFNGKYKQTSILYNLPNIQCTRVLLVGLGKESELDQEKYVEVTKTCASTLSQLPVNRIVNMMLENTPNDSDPLWALHTCALSLYDNQYRFDEFKTGSKSKLLASPDDNASIRSNLQEVIFGSTTINASDAAKTISQALAVGDGLALARNLSNQPGNICTPIHLANTATEIAKKFKLKIEIFKEADIKRKKMGAFLSVAKGSSEPPYFIILKYEGSAQYASSKKTKLAPIVLIGKGITFDSGGISLKPGEGMDEMKYDMCGAAAVLGSIQAAAQMKLPLDIIAIVPTCENMPAGNANKPGDIVTSLSGKTIEVLNTDAEGRLILCDALTYAESLKPELIIDVATLTGACVIALGNHRSGLYANDNQLAEELITAGENTLDLCWRMPLDDAYQAQLKSNFADVANIGGRAAGSVTGACFLKRFVQDSKWAHLDIAGTAWRSGASKGATGRPVPLLTQFLVNRSNNHFNNGLNNTTHLKKQKR